MDEVLKKIEKVLIFTAHADDCEFFAGGLTALLASQGAEITEVICTDNGRGSFELPTTELVSQSRDIEARKAAEILGKKQVEFLGHPDGFLDETPKNELRRIFIEWIRRVRPDAVLSFDAWAPFESHPDHVHVARAAVEAVGFANLPLYHPEQVEAGLLPHLTPYCFWFAKNEQLANWTVDVGEHIDTKIQAILAHTSQVRMMLQDYRNALTATGRNLHLLDLLDPENGNAAMELLMKTWAANVAKEEDFEFGEAYRREIAGELFDQAT